MDKLLANPEVKAKIIEDALIHRRSLPEIQEEIKEYNTHSSHNKQKTLRSPRRPFYDAITNSDVTLDLQYFA